MKKTMLLYLMLLMPALVVDAEISEREYAELLTAAVSRPLFMLKAENLEKAPKNVIDMYVKSIEARIRLCSEPPSSTLPVLYSLWLNNSYSNLVTDVYDINGEVKATASFKEAVIDQIRYQHGLTFGYDTLGHIGFLFITGKGDDLTANPNIYHYYWWYEGRSMMGGIWNLWLSCWERENKRDNPREPVLEELASEITGFSYHVFPYLYAELQKGDKTLQKVISKCSDDIRGGWRFENFVKWWEDNREKYTLPKPSGYDAIREQLSRDKSPSVETLYKCMERWHKNSKDFYCDPKNIESKYWYYLLPEKDVTIIDIKKLKNPYHVVE